MEYRREIDGLRALAVISVIFFHTGLGVFSGGFVGVDVFFVISGYLITTIILSELETGKFSIVSFYERRARRILPALFLVMAVCIPFAWLWLWPSDMKEFSQSLVAVPVFASNILFWHESGYFDTAAELKPLLHTWSLGVEEQFYVLFPLFLMLTWRFGRKWIVALLVIVSAISLAAAQWESVNEPAAAFFLLPTRGWELAIGSFMAFYFAEKERKELPLAANELLSLTGLALIVYSIFSYSETTPFPGFYTLVPAAGTALIILFAWQKTYVGRLLGSKPFVGVGLISYSAYLWHQPLFVFTRHINLEKPTAIVLILLSLVALVLAYLSWRFVEQPFRKKGVIGRNNVIAFVAFSSTLFIGMGVAGHIKEGFVGRVNPEILKIADPIKGYSAICGWKLGYSGENCVIGDSNSEPSIALIGDSHSRRITKSLHEAIAGSGRSLIVFSQDWCPPLLDLATDTPVKRPVCRELVKRNYATILKNKKIDTVILFAEWANYTKGMRWGDKQPSFYTDSSSKEKSLNENVAAFSRALERTRSALSAAAKKVIIVKSVPEYETKIPATLAKLFFQGKNELPMALRIDKARYFSRNSEENIFETSRIYKWATVVDPFIELCGAGYCKYSEGDSSFYTDGNHLSYEGSLPITKAILKHIAE